MTGKATGVFWIGLVLIFLNFWLSGQSSTIWHALTNPGTGGNSNQLNALGGTRANPFKNLAGKSGKHGTGAIGK
jgi:hypothetical protein